MEHSAILATFIKLLFIIKILVFSIFEWPFYTGLTVFVIGISAPSSPASISVPIEKSDDYRWYTGH